MSRRAAAPRPADPPPIWPSDPTVPTEWVPARHHVWSPQSPGSELVGRFLGMGEAEGPHGRFSVVRLRGLDNALWIVGGVSVIRSIEDAGVVQNEWIKLVYEGTENLGEGRTMKRFELFLGKPP